jgi:hypothetical protein
LCDADPYFQVVSIYPWWLFVDYKLLLALWQYKMILTEQHRFPQQVFIPQKSRKIKCLIFTARQIAWTSAGAFTFIFGGHGIVMMKTDNSVSWPGCAC